MNTGLLPKGFYDELYPEANKRMQTIYKLLSYFAKGNYQFVDPPLLEFEETLFADSWGSLKSETFRVMDPESNRMMGIRSDITGQVARIAVMRLHNDPRPLRLSYAGQVLKSHGDFLNGQRQLWQAGIELVGVDNVEADLEIVKLAIQSLKSLGIYDISIDFTIPILTPRLLESFDLPADDKKAVLFALDKKDHATIRKFLGDEETDKLLPLMQMEVSIDTIIDGNYTADVKDVAIRIRDIIRQLQKSNKDIATSFDPLESLKFHYHTGIGFALFAKGAKSELARGGRYEIKTNKEMSEPGVGATFYVNELLNIS